MAEKSCLHILILFFYLYSGCSFSVHIGKTAQSFLERVKTLLGIKTEQLDGIRVTLNKLSRLPIKIRFQM